MLDFMTRRHFQREIETFSPDIVLTWMNRATRFCPSSHRRGSNFVHVARLGGYYDLKYYRNCDHLIANTRGIVGYIERHGWAAANVHYIPNFADAAPQPPVFRDDLTTPEGASVVLALGRLHRNKAFDVLLRALPTLPDVWLWIAGSGPEEDELRGIAGAAGVADRVRFLGWRHDMAALMAAADLLVCPSRVEPLGNVIVEAWAHETPVVAAMADGPVELMEGGEDGLLVPMEDAPALAGAIRRVLSVPGLADHLIKRGRAKFEADFTEEKVVEQYLKLFEQLTTPDRAVA
jgi:glycosyltransferase involved in cell wall biosynthesis